MKQIQVVLADDHVLVRAGIRALLERSDRVKVVGEAGDGHEALELIAKLEPDVLLLDLTMPGLSGFEVLKETTESFPDVNVIVLSVHDSEEYAYHALHSGAAGYLPKNAASTELETAIDRVLNGERYLSPSITSALSSAVSTGIELTDLTPRQIEILRLIAGGSSTRAIAGILQISIKTVESHRSQLMQRLKIHDVAGLTRYAILKGLVDVDE